MVPAEAVPSPTNLRLEEIAKKVSVAVYCGGDFYTRQQTVCRLYAADSVTRLSGLDYEGSGSHRIRAVPTRAATPRE